MKYFIILAAFGTVLSSSALAGGPTSSTGGSEEDTQSVHESPFESQELNSAEDPYVENASQEYYDDDEFDDFDLTTVPVGMIKRPSRALPSKNVTCRGDAYAQGVKSGFKTSGVYNLINKTKEIVGLIPKSPKPKNGKLADAIIRTRNEARKLNENYHKQLGQFERVMGDSQLDEKTKKEAAQIALYFLERSHNELAPTLSNLKWYVGLSKGGVEVRLDGTPLHSKLTRETVTDYQKADEARKESEMRMLQRLSEDNSDIVAAKSRLKELNISPTDYQSWKTSTGPQLEATLNTFRAGGYITSKAVNGTAVTGLYLAIGAASLNPVMFAAGAYMAISSGTKIAEKVVRTRLQNNVIRKGLEPFNASETVPGLDPELQEKHHEVLARQKQEVELHAVVAPVETFHQIHKVVDIVANAAFTTGGLLVSLPATSVSTTTVASPL